jgi:BTB/POZ domain
VETLRPIISILEAATKGLLASSNDTPSNDVSTKMEEAAYAVAEKPPAFMEKACLRSSQYPDVTIVVGGHEFQEYSQIIRYWSDYFDKALGSGMKESTTMRLEFPDREPKEWELIKAISMPLSTTKIDQDNVWIALSWFEELCCPLGLQHCDIVLASKIEDVVVWIAGGEVHNDVLDLLEQSLRYCLPRSTAASFKAVARVLRVKTIYPSKAWVAQLVSTVSDDKDNVGKLLDIFEEFLPDSFSGTQKQSMLENGIPPALVFSQLEVRAYKPARGGMKRRRKLLAHMSVTRY